MENQIKLTELLAKNSKQVEEKVLKYRAHFNWIMMTSMISSGAATLIAGVTSAVGEAAEIGTEGGDWPASLQLCLDLSPRSALESVSSET